MQIEVDRRTKTGAFVLAAVMQLSVDATAHPQEQVHFKLSKESSLP